MHPFVSHGTGTFTGDIWDFLDSWNSLGDLDTTDETIRVVNGVLQ
jgi:hypothetical protein